MSPIPKPGEPVAITDSRPMSRSWYAWLLEMSRSIAAIYTGSVLLVPQLTTTQRNALTASNGMLIYNSTTNKFQGYQGGSWVDLA